MEIEKTDKCSSKYKISSNHYPRRTKGVIKYNNCGMMLLKGDGGHYLVEGEVSGLTKTVLEQEMFKKWSLAHG